MDDYEKSKLKLRNHLIIYIFSIVCAMILATMDFGFAVIAIIIGCFYAFRVQYYVINRDRELQKKTEEQEPLTYGPWYIDDL